MSLYQLKRHCHTEPIRRATATARIDKRDIRRGEGEVWKNSLVRAGLGPRRPGRGERIQNPADRRRIRVRDGRDILGRPRPSPVPGDDVADRTCDLQIVRLLGHRAQLGEQSIEPLRIRATSAGAGSFGTRHEIVEHDGDLSNQLTARRIVLGRTHPPSVRLELG